MTATAAIMDKAYPNQSKIGLKRVTVGTKHFLTNPATKDIPELGIVAGCRYGAPLGTKSSWHHLPNMGRYNMTANEKRKRETARQTLGL